MKSPAPARSPGDKKEPGALARVTRNPQSGSEAATSSDKLSQNKKAHNLALKSVLSEKVGKGLIVVDSYKLAKISTKEFAGKLKALGCEGKKNLIVVDGDDEKLILSARGIKNAGLVETDNIAVYDVLYFDNVIVSKEGIKKIEEALQ